jgi:tryptophanyl-tRNA synthetase
MRIKTNSLEPGQPKDTAGSTLYAIYAAFAAPAEIAAIEKRYAEGIAWGEMKQILFERIDGEVRGMRAEYEKLIADPAHVESVLRAGAAKARELSVPFLADIRRRVGVRPLG